jgi:hypothetical protein
MTSSFPIQIPMKFMKSPKFPSKGDQQLYASPDPMVWILSGFRCPGVRDATIPKTHVMQISELHGMGIRVGDQQSLIVWIQWSTGFRNFP